ncbi:uncharacterized protein [Oscarella lobularis]|uniref:uncharacterized protein isoform X2 n=1 Tax=Oscarella lobularis TaxID=121494 RepID=UPI003313D2BD
MDEKDHKNERRTTKRDRNPEDDDVSRDETVSPKKMSKVDEQFDESSEDPNVMKSNFIEIERVCKERKEQEKPVYRITIPAGEISRIFIHEGEAIQMTKGWLRGIRADCKAGMSRLDRVSTPLFINGLMKTGKTAWLCYVVPAMIKARFGGSGDTAPVILTLNLKEVIMRKTPFSFLLEVLSLLRSEMLDSNLSGMPDSIPTNLEECIEVLRSTVKWLSDLPQLVFILIDEIQRLFSWTIDNDGKTLDEEVQENMRDLLRTLTSSDRYPHCHFVLTGSCMAQAYINFVKMSSFGRSFTSSSTADLPGKVSQAAYSEAIVAVKHNFAVRFSEEDLSIVDRLAKHADSTPALLQHLVFQFGTKALSAQSSDDKINDFAVYEIGKKLFEEIWNDFKPYLFQMSPKVRKVLGMLFTDEGVSREEIESEVTLSGGWRMHMKPFMETCSEGRNLRVSSKPFYAFVLSAFDENGDLNESLSIESVVSYLITLEFIEAILRIGEEVNIIVKKPSNQISVVLAFCQLLRSRNVSSFVTTPFFLKVDHLCGPLQSKFKTTTEDAVRHTLRIIRNKIGHEIRKTHRLVKEAIGLRPFSYHDFVKEASKLP